MRKLAYASPIVWVIISAPLALIVMAVTVSGGGGAELVSAEQARAGIERGEQIAIDDAGSLQNLVDIRFDRRPAKTTASWYPVVLASRQAGMFVNYLRESDGLAFDRMMKTILDGRAFAQAVDVGYHDDVRSLWKQFIKSSADRRGQNRAHGLTFAGKR